MARGDDRFVSPRATRRGVCGRAFTISRSLCVDLASVLANSQLGVDTSRVCDSAVAAPTF